MLTELEIKHLQFAQNMLWKAMDFAIKQKGYSDFTLYLEGAARDLRDIEEKYSTGGTTMTQTKVRGFEVVSDQHCKHTDVEIQLPRRADKGACASDIYSPVDVTLTPGERILIWTDVKAYMQEGEVLIANVRSSHGKPLVRLANTQGWIDQTHYENPVNDGNIGIYISNEGEESFDIAAGDRIAQLMFIPFLVPDNDNPIHDSRNGGFGSSGK